MNGLVSFWKLADVNDAIGGETLTNVNSATFGAGKIGDCIDNCDGTDTTGPYLAKGTSSALAITSEDFTISAWFNMNALRSNQHIMGKGPHNASAGEYTLGIASTGKPRLHINVGGAFKAVTSTVVAGTGSWLFVCATRHDTGTNNELKIWVDGVKTEDLTITSGDITNGGRDFTIGGRRSSVGGSMNYAMDALVDACGLWKRALTDLEVAELRYSGNGKEPPF